MTEFFRVPVDLHVRKEDVEKMEKGDAGLGYIEVPEQERHLYELINKHAFQPVLKEHILNENTYNVVFILK